MRWYNKMYLGESIQGKKMYYQYAIQHTKRLTGTYCLILRSTDSISNRCQKDDGQYQHNQTKTDKHYNADQFQKEKQYM